MNSAPAQRWRKRAPDNKGNLGDLLIERAKQGMCIRMNESELQNREKYGKRPPNRICDLRRDGWDIGGKPLGESDWCYWLRRDEEGNLYPQTRRFEPNEPNSPRPQLVARPEIPWGERPLVKTNNYGRPLEIDLPLFVGVRG
jgi:hypothetical protein